MNNKTMFACPCCNYLTFDTPNKGTFEICPVCYWEDDEVQFNDPNFAGGANEISLNEARINFKEFGASSYLSLKFVRKPKASEIPSS